MREILTTARNLIESGWTKHKYARDNFEQPVDVNEEIASCFCTMGALYRAAGASSSLDEYDDRLVEPAVKALDFGEIAEVLCWNDNPERTKEEVLARFDEAIGGLVS